MKVISWNVNGLRACVGTRAVSFLGEITAKVVKDGVTYAEGSVHMAEEDKMHYWHKYTLTITA